MADAYEFTADKGIIDWDAYPRGYRGRKQKCIDPGNVVIILASMLFIVADGYLESQLGGRGWLV